MDIRTLKYFLAVAQEENITKAAEILHMSQPPLSRQLHDLEEELGVKLFERTNRKVILTSEGALLRQRAEEILELVEKTKADVSPKTDNISGDIYIGSGETEGIRTLAKVIFHVRNNIPKFVFIYTAVTRRTFQTGLTEDFWTLASALNLRICRNMI